MCASIVPTVATTISAINATTMTTTVTASTTAITSTTGKLFSFRHFRWWSKPCFSTRVLGTIDRAYFSSAQVSVL